MKSTRHDDGTVRNEKRPAMARDGWCRKLSNVGERQLFSADTVGN